MIIWIVIIAIVILALAGLYLMAVMPRITDRPDFNPFHGWYFAHRGLHDNKSDAPENTLAAFKNAVRAGYGIEMDIQLTKDKIPVVFHDYTLKRTCGEDIRVDSLNLAELKKRRVYGSKEAIPTLEEVLKEVDGKVPLIVEFKVEALNLALCPIAAPLLDCYQGTYCMESFNPLCVRWYKKNRNTVVRGQLSTNFIKDKEKGNKILFWLHQNQLLNFLGKPDFIAFNYKHSNMLSFNICHGLYRLPSFAWTIRSEEALEQSRRKFDYVIFDSFRLKK